MILSRLDYCNSMLSSLQSSTVASLLQRVQNATARIVLGLLPREHVSLALMNLHWLRVCYHIEFQPAHPMCMAHIGWSPTYISDAVTSISRGSISSSTVLCQYHQVCCTGNKGEVWRNSILHHWTSCLHVTLPNI